MSLQSEFLARVADEGIPIFSMSTEDLRRVNEIITELLRKYKEDE